MSRKKFPVALFKKAYNKPSSPDWFVYVLHNLAPRSDGKPGPYYVGCTNDVPRRFLQHQGLLPGGAHCTASHRPWKLAAVFGSYANRSEALRAEYALKHGKRGKGRVGWTPEDSPWCRGLGQNDPLVLSQGSLVE